MTRARARGFFYNNRTVDKIFSRKKLLVRGYATRRGHARSDTRVPSRPSMCIGAFYLGPDDRLTRHAPSRLIPEITLSMSPETHVDQAPGHFAEAHDSPENARPFRRAKFHLPGIFLSASALYYIIHARAT